MRTELFGQRRSVPHAGDDLDIYAGPYAGSAPRSTPNPTQTTVNARSKQ
ncbi:hypothetical protein QM600_11810 [Rhodococcus sp. IEGM 1379]|nr:hypothetical protein [Rhodococcus sp. IEGM 1379]